jgi:hypothetical protein
LAGLGISHVLRGTASVNSSVYLMFVAAATDSVFTNQKEEQ